MRGLLQPLLLRRGLATCSACLFSVVLFYVCDWSWLQLSLAKALSSFLWSEGYELYRRENHLWMNSTVFTITAECTYVDLILCAMPFVWRRGSIGKNAWRTTMLVSTILLVNFFRVYVSMVGFTLGLQWFWVHDFIDYCLWYPSLTLFILTWLASEKRLHEHGKGYSA